MKIIVKIIQFFHELYPEVIVELCDTHWDELGDWLGQGGVDIAVTVLGEKPDPLTTQMLFQQRLLLGLPSHHPFAQKQDVMLTELEQEP